MTKKTRNWLLALFIVAFPFVLFCGFLILMEEPPAPLAPLPKPNGYDDLVKAGEMIKGEVWDYNKTNLEQLRGIVLTNAGALSLARIALSNHCGVTLDFSATSSAHLKQLTGIKLLAFAFAAEGRLAEMESHPGNAAKSYLDMIHLSNESSRGGSLIDQLVGMALEALGISRLQEIASQLDAKTSREAAGTLETLDSQRQTWNEVLQQEKNWSRKTFPGWGNELARLMERHSLEKEFQKAEQRFKQQQIKTRQLMITLAARAYELDKGHRPASVAELVPEYLKAVPQDPVTGTNIVSP